MSIKVKHFPVAKNHDEDFNAFIAKHPPRNTKNQSGVVLNPNGLYVFYEEGEPLLPNEQAAELREMIRTKKSEILIVEPMLRLKRKETATFREQLQKMGDHESELNKQNGSYDVKKRVKDAIKETKAKLEANEAWLLGNESNVNNAKEQIEYLTSVLQDIEKGVWSA